MKGDLIQHAICHALPDFMNKLNIVMFLLYLATRQFPIFGGNLWTELPSDITSSPSPHYSDGRLLLYCAIILSLQAVTESSHPDGPTHLTFDTYFSFLTFLSHFEVVVLSLLTSN